MSGFEDFRNRAEGTAVQPSATDNLRQQYVNMQRHADMPLPPGQVAQPGSDRVQQRNSISSQNFDNPITHLDVAKALMKQGDQNSEAQLYQYYSRQWAARGLDQNAMAQAWQQLQNPNVRRQMAMQEYYAAIRAADTIDQTEVAQARKAAQDKLKTEQDPTERRKLAQWDETLHDMQRAPGFTRANLGMLWIRMGYQGDGIRLIVEAGTKDPEMRTDPNFIRHMRMLNMQVPLDPRTGQPGGPPGYETRPTGGLPQPGDVRPPQPSDQTGRPTGTVRPEGNFNNPLIHLELANRALSELRSLDGKLSTDKIKIPIDENGNFKEMTVAERRRELERLWRAEYPASIQAADNLDRPYILQQVKALDDESKQYFVEANEKKIAERDLMLKELKTKDPASADQLEKLDKAWGDADLIVQRKTAELKQATTEDQKKAIQAEIDKANKTKKDAEDLMAGKQATGAVNGPDGKPLLPVVFKNVSFTAQDLVNKTREVQPLEADPKHQKFIELQAKIESLKQLYDSSSVTRFAYAFALSEDAKQADQVLKGNLTDGQRITLKGMSGQTNLTAEQKTLLAGIAAKDTLTDADRAQLKQLASQANLTAQQKSVLNAMNQQFTLPDTQKTQLQTLIQQERAKAVEVLGQIVQIDSSARRDPDFVKLAKELGFQIPPEQVSERVKDQAPTVADLTKDGHPLLLLEGAHQVEKERDFATAKPKYLEAIAAADKLDQTAIKQKVDFYTAAVKDESLDEASRRKALQMALVYGELQHSPFITRFQYAIALSNAAVDKKPGGDAALAKQTLAEAAAKDAKAAEEPVYKFVKDKIEKGQKVTDDDLKKFAPSADQPASTGGGGTVSPELLQIAAAMKKVEEAGKNQNYMTAEASMKEAIAAADKMDMTTSKAALAAAKADVEKYKVDGTADGIAKCAEARSRMKEAQDRIDLPILLRLELAKFYMNSKVHKPDEAKKLLEDKDFLAKYPDAKKRPDYKAVKGFADEYCKSTLDKALEWASKEWKGLVSDFGSGGIAAIVYAANPEAGFLKRLGVSVLAGALAKPAINTVLGNRPTSWSGLGADMGWGSVNSLMFIAGGEARGALMGRIGNKVDTLAMKEQALLLAKTVEQKTAINKAFAELAMQQDVHTVDAIGKLFKQQFGASIKIEGENGLKSQAMRLGVSEAAVDTALKGKTGSAAIDAWVKLLEGHSINSLDSRMLLGRASALGIEENAIKELAAKQEAARIDTVASMLKQQLGEKVDGKKLIPHAEALGIGKAEAAQLQGKTGQEAIDTLATLLKQRAEAGHLDMAALTEKASALGVDKFKLTHELAIQDRVAVEALGDLLKKDLTKVDATALSAQARAMGVAESELKKLEGKTGAEAVDAFTSILKAKAETGLSMAPLTEMATKMGVSGSALRDITSKRNLQTIDAVEKMLVNHIDDQRTLAKQTLEIVRKYKLDGMKEGDGKLLAAHLEKLGVPKAPNYAIEGLETGNSRQMAAHLERLGVPKDSAQLKALAEGTLNGEPAKQAAVTLLAERMTLMAEGKIKGAEASKTAVAMLKDLVASRERTAAEALAIETKDMGRLSIQRIFYTGKGKAGEASAYATSKEELAALRAQFAPGRLESLGSRLKTWLPWAPGESKFAWAKRYNTWVGGEEGTIYREYANLRAGARGIQGASFGPINLSYLNPNNLLDLRRGQGAWGYVPFTFRDVNAFNSLNNLKARSFFNMYKVDFASIGLMSLMYRGAHNTHDVILGDEKTGKKMSVSDAAWSTGLGSLQDAGLGALMMPVFREMGGALTRGGSLAESVQSSQSRAPWTKPGLYNKVALTWRAPTYAAGQYVARPLSNLVSTGAGMATDGITTRFPRIPMGLSTLPGNAANFSPRLQEIPGMWSIYSSTSALLDANAQPIQNLDKPIDPLDEEEVDDKDRYKKDEMTNSKILDYIQAQREAGKTDDEINADLFPEGGAAPRPELAPQPAPQPGPDAPANPNPNPTDDTSGRPPE